MDRALILVVLLLAGCTKSPTIDFTLAPHIPCSVGPIVLHHGDVLTDATGKEIVALDETGETLCDWKAPSK